MGRVPGGEHELKRWCWSLPLTSAVNPIVEEARLRKGHRRQQLVCPGSAHQVLLGNSKADQMQSSGVKHLETLKGEKPVVNQLEIHPFMQQKDITDYCAKNGQ